MGCAGSKAAEDDASLTGLGPGAEGAGKEDSTKGKGGKERADSKRSSKADSKRSSKGGSTIKAKLGLIKLVCKTFVEGAGPQGKTECATCHFEYGQHECCGHFLRGSDAPESKGCKQCGLCWPEHQACPKFATSGGHDGAAPETGDGMACETCGVPVNGHPVCDGYDKDAEGGRCGGCGRARSDHAPCLHYRVNLQADTFGDCLCTFGKSEHVEAAFHASKAGASTAKKKHSDVLRQEFAQKETVDCPRFAPDMVSGSFGQCTCGAMRADHSEGALSHGTGGAAAREAKAYGKTKKDSVQLHKEFTMKDMVSCPRYVPNLVSGSFGECECGAKRADHTEEARAQGTGEAGAQGKVKRDSAEVRKGFVQREVADCAKFVLNTDPAAPFGMCTCGRPAQEHADAAKGREGDAAGKKTPRTDEEAQARMAEKAAAIDAGQ